MKQRQQSQTKKILAHLLKGKKLTGLSVQKLCNSRYINSRISDIRNKMGIPVSDEWINTKDAKGEPVRVKRYFLLPETIDKIKGKAA